MTPGGLLCMVLGSMEVNAIKAYYCHFNKHLNVPLYKNFVDSLVVHLLANNNMQSFKTIYSLSHKL